MKAVRFTKVVEKCGKPDVYLLLTETDPDFQKALRSDKIMSLSDDSHGAGADYGKVGYDKKRKGQLLLFPKSLKAFREMKIVGLKYDLFAEEEAPAASPKKPTVTKETPKKEKARAASRPSRLPSKAAKEPAPKVIRFPKSQENREADEGSVSAWQGYARQAMRALEKNNSVAAYNLLKRIVGE